MISFFRNKIFYWGCYPQQDTVYVLTESENILSLHKYGSLWEIETRSSVDTSQPDDRGGTFQIHRTVKVEKTIVRSDPSGRTRMYIYFKGG